MHNIFHSICEGNNTLKTLIKSIYIHFRHYSKHYCFCRTALLYTARSMRI